MSERWKRKGKRMRERKEECVRIKTRQRKKGSVFRSRRGKIQERKEEEEENNKAKLCYLFL